MILSRLPAQEPKTMNQNCKNLLPRNSVCKYPGDFKNILKTEMFEFFKIKNFEQPQNILEVIENFSF